MQGLVLMWVLSEMGEAADCCPLSRGEIRQDCGSQAAGAQCPVCSSTGLYSATKAAQAGLDMEISVKTLRKSAGHWIFSWGCVGKWFTGPMYGRSCGFIA